MKKALAALIVIVCVGYGIAGKSAATQSTLKVQNSLDRMTAVEAALK
jgi:hypothetical protein